MPTREEINSWIKEHNAYDLNANQIARSMLIEAVERTPFAEQTYPGIKEDLIKTVTNTKLPEINRKLTTAEFNLMKEIRKQTEASYRDIIAGIKIHGLDKEAVIDYLREICVVRA